MRKLRFGHWIIALGAIFGLVILGGAVGATPNARAQEAQQVAPDNQTAPADRATTTKEQTVTDRQEAVKDKRAAVKTHLADAKLKVCQAREHTITNILSRFADRGTKQMNVFSTIADRTEAFYASANKTLDTYDTLVANVASAKAEAQAAVDAVTSSSTTFSCDGTDPKGMAANFKTNLKAEITALKNYKTSVKNLIVGVKSVQGITTSTAMPARTEETQ